MIVYVPLSVYQKVPEDVILSLRDQTVKPKIVIVGIDGLKDTESVINKSNVIAKTRNLIAKLAMVQNDYAAMCDSDIIQMYPGNFALGLKKLKSDTSLGAVALLGGWQNHVAIQTVMLSPKAWGLASFNHNVFCNCLALAKSIEPLKIEYLDNKIRIYELSKEEKGD